MATWSLGPNIYILYSFMLLKVTVIKIHYKPEKISFANLSISSGGAAFFPPKTGSG